MTIHLFNGFKNPHCIFLKIIIFLFVSLSVQASYANDNSASVVKVFVTSNAMDYYRPWQSEGMQTSSGSGAIIDGKGGGHANAAGANGKRNLDRALAKSLEIIRGAIEGKTTEGAE